MIKLKRARVESANPQVEKRDILTEVFEHFGIKVIDVTNQNSKFKKKNN